MMATRRRQRLLRWGIRVLPAVVLALCLAVTWLAWSQSRRRDEAALRAEFTFLADKTVSAIENHFQDNIQVLRGVAGLFAGSREVDRREFREYVTDLHLEERYPGILGVGFSLVVPGGETGRHERRVRGEGFPDYAIFPPGERDHSTSVIYLEPFSGINLRAFGYDMYSEPVRRAAMARARDEGEPALSGKVRLVQESGTDSQAGFILFVPVYRQGASHADLMTRRANLIGWAFSPLQMKDMMQSLPGSRFREMGRLIDIQLYDGEMISPEALMFDSAEGSGVPRSAFETDRTLHTAGHVWTIRMRSRPVFDARLFSEKGSIILGTGIGLSLLLSLQSLILVRSREKIAASLAHADRANRELTESEERFRSFYDLGLIGMAITSPDTGWLQVNDRLCEILGYPREEIVEKTWPELTHPDDVKLDLEQFRRVMSGEIDGYSLEKRFIRKDGGIVHASISAQCQRRPDGSVRQFVALIDDITDRKQLEAKLQEYSEGLESQVLLRTREIEEANRELVLRRDQAEAANQAKSMFLAVMSHELRTPLNAILGLSEMLRDGIMGSLAAEQRNALATIEESGRHLLAVITDILDLSKIEADRMDLELAPVDLEELCRAALRFVREPALKKKITLTFTGEQTPETLHTDQRRLKQILVNLLSNAVKFTPEGGSVGLEAVGDEARREVRLTVRDTGIGIAPEDQDKLFHPFVQVDSSLARRFEGTGLGLALVARLTRLLGGEVTVESEAGEGSRFTVTLPWREGDGAWGPASPPHEASSPETGRTFADAPFLLLVEDSRASREMMTGYLRSVGCRIMTAVTGTEAVARARDRCPDLILMDIQMPDMDGLTAIREIRTLPPPGNAVPIIALTALAMPGDEERCREAGADAYLGKPFRLRELQEQVAGLLEKKVNGER